MIKLNRHALPSDLSIRLEILRIELLRRLDAGEDAKTYIGTKYKDAALKGILKAESHEKCIYCEAKIIHTQFGDVEHIRPKSRYPRMALDHSNLGISCARCNNAKNDHWDESLPFLNPYIDDPEQQLRAFGPMLQAVAGSAVARHTLTMLELNRAGLLEQRAERLQRLHPLVEAYLTTSDTNLKRLAERELLNEARDDKEFACVVRSYLKDNSIAMRNVQSTVSSED